MTEHCSVCKRDMTAKECGDETPDERVCDTCAGIDHEPITCRHCGEDSQDVESAQTHYDNNHAPEED